MESHEELLAWAIERGVKLNAIEPKRIPGRGIGIVAARAIKVCYSLFRCAEGYS